MVHMKGIKSVVKILLLVIALWLVTVAMQTTFSTYVEPLNYNAIEEYDLNQDEYQDDLMALEYIDEIEEDIVEATFDDELVDDEDGELVEFDPTPEIVDSVEDGENLFEYRDGVYYWTGDIDDDSVNMSDYFGITPFWSSNQNQAGMLTISGNVNTNGFSRTGNITIPNNATLTISGSTTITGRIVINNGGTLIMNSGTVNFSSAPPSGALGLYGHYAGVTLNGANATFTMNGGLVTGANSRGIRIHGGTFNLHGGEVARNTLPAGANLAHPNTNHNGGGIRITASNSTINMTGGSIHSNTTGQGGGILYSGGFNNSGPNNRVTNVVLNLSGGSITNNRALSTAFGGGGGIDLISDRLVNQGATNNEANRLVAGSVIDLNLSDDIEISHNTSVESGGGIRWNSMGTLRMTGGHIHNNRASLEPTAPSVTTNRFVGGGIAMAFSSNQNNARQVGDVIITGGIIENNTAHGHGGGIGNFTMAHLTISGNTIIRNNTSGWSGGGIRSSYGGATRLDNVTITDNALITNNKAYHGGGGVSRTGAGNLIINNNNVRITNNTARYDGGGVNWISSGLFTLSNGIITGNLAESRADRTVSTPSPNDAFGGGGGISVGGGTINISGGIIGETTAPPAGATANPSANLTTPANTMTPNSNRGLHGAGLRIVGGTVTMTGGYIQRNVTTTTATANTALANGRGGGVFINGGTFTYNTATGHIRNNLASRGGGAYVMAPLVSGNAPFVMTNGPIRDNEAMLNGGGVYVANPSRADMNGGNIQGNLARGTGPVGPNPVFGQPLQGITPGAQFYDGHGGGVYVQRNAAFRAATGRITDNNAQTGDGGGIYTEFRLYECDITPAGATGNYSNITIGAGVVFSGNDAHRHTLRTPCNPEALTTINRSVPITTSPFPGGAWPVAPGGNHPLNNFDVNYLQTYEIVELDPPSIIKDVLNEAGAVIPPLPNEGRIFERGDTVTYRLTVTNPNNEVLANHLVIDNLAGGPLDPTTVENVRVNPASALVDYDVIAGELRVILNLPANSNVTITFEVDIRNNVEPGEIENIATLFGPPEAEDAANHDPFDPSERDEIDEDEEVIITLPEAIIIPDPDLDPPSIVKDVLNAAGTVIPPIPNSGRIFEPGATVTYRLTVTNPNDVPLPNHLVIDNLAGGALDPETVENVRVNPASALVDYDVIDGELRVILNLPPGNVTITFEVDIRDDVEPGEIENIATLFGPPEDPDAEDHDPFDPSEREEIEEDEEVIIIPDPEAPSIVKDVLNAAGTVIPPIPNPGRIFEPGATVTYRLTVTNPNDVPLSNHLVIDNLAGGALDPETVENVRVNPASALVDYDVIAGELRVILNLPPGNVTITFEVDIRDDVEPGEIENIATLFGPPEDPDAEDHDPFDPSEREEIEEDEEVIIVRNPEAPSIIKDVLDEAGNVIPPLPHPDRIFEIGATVTYRLTITNPNDEVLSNHLVVDNFASGDLDPETITNIRVNPTSALVDYDIIAGELRVILNLPANSDVTITFEVDIAATATPGSYVENIGYIYGAPEDPDDDPFDRDTRPPEGDDNEIILIPPAWVDPELVKDVIDEEGNVIPPMPDEGRIFERGATVTYRLTVINDNGIDFPNHLVVDNLANGALDWETVTNVSVNPASALIDYVVRNGELLVLLDLPGMSEVTITFEVDIREDVEPGEIENIATLFGPPENPDAEDHDSFDPSERDELDEDDEVIITPPPVVDPELEKEVIDEEGNVIPPIPNLGRYFERGATVTYRLTVTNDNDIELPNYLVVDNLANGALDPATATNVRTNTASALVDYVVRDDELLVLLDLPANSEVSITFEVDINQTVALGSEVENNGYLYGPPADPEEDPFDRDTRPPVDDDNEIILIPPAWPDPELVKDVLDESGNVIPPMPNPGRIFERGATVTYRLTVINDNIIDLPNHLVVDNLANGALDWTTVTNVTVSPTSALVNYVVRNGELLVLLDLPGMSEVTITFEVNIREDVEPGEIENIATLFGPPADENDENHDPFDPSERDELDEDDEVILIPPDPEDPEDPEIEKDVIEVNRETVTYKLKVRNPNTEKLPNHLVIDNLAQGDLINPRNIVVEPANALVEVAGDNPRIVRVEVEAGYYRYELRALLDLPAGGMENDVAIPVVTITFDADIYHHVPPATDVENTGYLYGPPEDPEGDLFDPNIRPPIDEDNAIVTTPPDEEAPSIDKDVIDENGEILPEADRVFAPQETVTYRLSIRNPNMEELFNHLVIDNLAQGDLVNPRNIVVEPASALVNVEGDNPRIVRVQVATGVYRYELRALLDLPAGGIASGIAMPVVTITFDADIADHVPSATNVVNTGYLYGPPDVPGGDPFDPSTRPPVDEDDASVITPPPPSPIPSPPPTTTPPTTSPPTSAPPTTVPPTMAPPTSAPPTSPCPSCPPCLPEQQCPPCPPCSPCSSVEQPPNEGQQSPGAAQRPGQQVSGGAGVATPVLPQTGIIAGLATLTILGGSALAASVLVVAKKKSTGGPSENSLDDEYGEMFDDSPI